MMHVVGTLRDSSKRYLKVGGTKKQPVEATLVEIHHREFR
ncbi:hypothetical protein DesLBE_2441 [Desulfitobacterium sp. LBE]|uniref:Uncharacterized protein n=1 Tax=Desulfitobacterium hafniense TaxID=49338 RepID=A0A098B8F3_DESHA|nr:hypothetical protein DesLBE_2441 [Desulfitobacterium sp. LBE]CDX04640.1 Hypothetical protein DPCES_4754 [Desulfitobacterium hafniense]